MKLEIVKKIETWNRSASDESISFDVVKIRECCNEIKKHYGELMQPTVNHLFNDEDETIFVIHIVETYSSYGDWLDNEYDYCIKFCPFCGAKIEIAVVDELDTTNQYKELSSTEKQLRQVIHETDSKKESDILEVKLKATRDAIEDLLGNNLFPKGFEKWSDDCI